MPIPLFAWGVIAGVAGLVAAAAIFADAKGKSVVILGNRYSGKSTFHSFLATGTIPKGYTPTLEPVVEKDIKFEDFRLKIKATDVSGAKDEWLTWKEGAEKADLVCFFASWEQLCDVAGQEQIDRAAKQVGSWDLKAKTMLVISFLDKSGMAPAEVVRDARVRSIRQYLNAGQAMAVDQTDEMSRRDLAYQTLKALQ